jgi:hypothetical protein
VNTTGVLRTRRKTRIVRRLDFGPLVEIHEREARRPDIDAWREVRDLLEGEDEGELPAAPDDDGGEAELPATRDADADVEPPTPANGTFDCEPAGADGVETVTGGDEMGDLGLGSVGTGSTGGGAGSAFGVGVGTVGAGKVGVGKVGVGKVGVGKGRPSASATPAKTPSTTSTEARAADLIAEITSNAPFRVRGPPESPRSACGEGGLLRGARCPA